MIIVNTDFISGKEIETIQLVKGSIVFSKNVVRDIFAGLKTIIGGEIAGYSEMMSEARQKATERMMDLAERFPDDTGRCHRERALFHKQPNGKRR